MMSLFLPITRILAQLAIIVEKHLKLRTSFIEVPDISSNIYIFILSYDKNLGWSPSCHCIVFL